MSALLRSSWQIYCRHFPVILGIVVVVWIPLELLSSYMDAHVFGEDDFHKSWRFARFLDNFFGIIVTAGVIFVAFEALAGRRTTVGAGLSMGFRSWGRMFWTRILCSLVTVLGLFALIIPGLYLLVRLSFAEAVAVGEEISGPAAMRRSFALTKDRFWEVTRLCLAIAGILLLAIAAFIVPVAVVPGLDHWLFEALSQVACDVIIAFGTIVFAAAYVQFKDEPAPPPIAAGDTVQAGL